MPALDAKIPFVPVMLADKNTHIAGGDIYANDFNRNIEVNINADNILDVLIREAGRYCNSHASDLFIDWESIMEKFHDFSIESSTYLFGFRDSGVDHYDFIIGKIENCGLKPYYYRSIWKLDIEVDEHPEIERKYIAMKLYEVNYYNARKEY